MLDKHIAMEALDAALSTGGDFAEIFAEDRRDQAVALQDSHVERVNSGRLHGAGVRVYDGASAVYAYTNDFGRDGLLKCAKEAASAIRAQRQGRTAVQPMEERHFRGGHSPEDRRAPGGGQGGPLCGRRNFSGALRLHRQRAERADLQQRRPVRRRYPRLFPPALSGGSLQRHGESVRR